MSNPKPGAVKWQVVGTDKTYSITCTEAQMFERGFRQVRRTNANVTATVVNNPQFFLTFTPEKLAHHDYFDKIHGIRRYGR